MKKRFWVEFSYLTNAGRRNDACEMCEKDAACIAVKLREKYKGLDLFIDAISVVDGMGGGLEKGQVLYGR